jgi:hypothetical protein
MTLDTEVALEHYGVKGMRWGRRGTHQPDSDKPAGRSKIKTAAKAAVGIGAGLAVQAAAGYIGLKVGAKLGAKFADLEADKIVKGRDWMAETMAHINASPIDIKFV